MDMNVLFGKTVLWIGNECRYWSIGTFINAAKQARALGFHSICPKRADGTIKWYNTSTQLADEAHAVRAVGCGYIPFGYSYGPKFGIAQVREECAVLQEMGNAVKDAEGNAFVQADMESEWNGAVAQAKVFEGLMRPWPGFLSVSTWADPNIQNWDGVAAALAPCVNAWTPQRYNDFLAHQPLPPQETVIQPGVDMTQEFGTNHPLAIAYGHPCVFVWERATALANPTLARDICNRVG